MKSNGLYWTDSNNNSWLKSENTKKQAEEKSSTMIDCRGCSGCSYCRGCRDCIDFTTNPMRYTGQIMGSRKSQTTTYWTVDKNQVTCGCFRGTIDEFEAKVNSVYSGHHHGVEYAKYIKIVRAIMEMEK